MDAPLPGPYVHHATKLVWGGCGDHFGSREPCDPLLQLPCLGWIHTEESVDLFVQNQRHREKREDLLGQRRKDHGNDTKVSSRGNKAKFEGSGSQRAHRFTRLYGIQGCPFDLKLVLNKRLLLGINNRLIVPDSRKITPHPYVVMLPDLFVRKHSWVNRHFVNAACEKAICSHTSGRESQRGIATFRND